MNIRLVVYDTVSLYRSKSSASLQLQCLGLTLLGTVAYECNVYNINESE